MLHLFSTNVALRQALVNLSKSEARKNGYNPSNAGLIREIKSYLTAKSQMAVFEKECRELEAIKKKLQEENQALEDTIRNRSIIKGELQDEIFDLSETVAAYQTEIEELESKKAELLEAEDLQTLTQ